MHETTSYSPMTDIKLPERRPTLIAPVMMVERSQREGMKQQRACCIWLTGLSGAGKSTLGNRLDQSLQANVNLMKRLSLH